MEQKKSLLLVGAALTGLLMVSGCANKNENVKADEPVAAASADPTGECHGINSCKGQGECGAKGHACAGKNACKGKGWVKLSKSECTKKGGKFKAE